MGLLGRLFARPEPLWIEHVAGRAGLFEAVAIAGGRRIPVVGTRLAREGIVFSSPVRVRESLLRVTFTVRRRAIRSRVRVLREELVRNASRVVHNYVCTFVEMADDDRTSLGRFLDGLPDAGRTDKAGLLTPRAMAGVTARLVRMNRLAPPSPSAPLIRVTPLGQTEAEDGRTIRNILVTSRVRIGTTLHTYETRFNVYSDDEVVLV
jgi:hypothetical protein